MILGCGIALALVAAVSVFFSLVIQWAWNIFVSPAFGAPEITFVQAFAAALLLSILGTFFSRSSSK